MLEKSSRGTSLLLPFDERCPNVSGYKIPQSEVLQWRGTGDLTRSAGDDLAQK
jgi:hypothetical protein